MRNPWTPAICLPDQKQGEYTMATESPPSVLDDSAITAAESTQYGFKKKGTLNKPCGGGLSALSQQSIAEGSGWRSYYWDQSTDWQLC
jgi:hypothetical protein